MEIEADQNDPYWEKVLRPGPKGIRVNASEAAVAVGVDRRKLPASLYDHIQAGRPDYGEWEDEINYRKLGHAGEPAVCEYYAGLTSYELKKGHYWTHYEFPDYYGCSPDRRVFQGGKMIGIMEAKTFWNKLPESIPVEHLCQVMFQLWVTRAPWCDYVGLLMNKDDPTQLVSGNVLVFRVYPDQEYINWMEPRLFRFSRCLEDKIRPKFGTAIDEKDPPPPVEVKSLFDILFPNDFDF